MENCRGGKHPLPYNDDSSVGVFKYLKNNSATKPVLTRSSDVPAEAKDKRCPANRKSHGRKEENGSWWCYDLGENYSLSIAHCTLTRNSQDPILGKWILKGSTNLRDWEWLAKKPLVNPPVGAKCTWLIQGGHTTFRYFKILQNGQNKKNTASSVIHANYGIFLSRVELYGTLYLKKHGAQILNRCPQSKSKPLSSLLQHENSLQKVCAVLDTFVPGCGNYRVVAQYFGFNHHQIETVLRPFHGGPWRALIENLAARYPDLTVEEFAVVVEKKTERKDAAQLLRKYDTARGGSL